MALGDLAAVVYDPPAPGVPHMAVLFDGLWRGHRGALVNPLAREGSAGELSE